MILLLIILLIIPSYGLNDNRNIDIVNGIEKVGLTEKRAIAEEQKNVEFQNPVNDKTKDEIKSKDSIEVKDKIKTKDEIDEKHSSKSAIARGAEVYLNTCIKCHEISDIKYSDLIRLGADIELQKGKVVSEKLMEQNINLTSVIRSKGFRYVLNILKGYKKDENGEWFMKDDMYYNYFFKDNYIKMPPLLTDEQMIKDVVVFLEWGADRHVDMRFKMGLKVVAFLFILLIFIGVFLVLDSVKSLDKLDKLESRK